MLANPPPHDVGISDKIVHIVGSLHVPQAEILKEQTNARFYDSVAVGPHIFGIQIPRKAHRRMAVADMTGRTRRENTFRPDITGRNHDIVFTQVKILKGKHIKRQQFVVEAFDEGGQVLHIRRTNIHFPEGRRQLIVFHETGINRGVRVQRMKRLNDPLCAPHDIKPFVYDCYFHQFYFPSATVSFEFTPCPDASSCPKPVPTLQKPRCSPTRG